MRDTIYTAGPITITRRTFRGKIALGGHNADNGATVTAFATNDEQIPEKVARMVTELQKDSVLIDLTSRLERIEQNTIKTLNGGN